MAKASIFSLFGEIFIDNEKANKSINDTKDAGEKTGKSLTEKFGAIAKKSVEVGTAIVGASTAVIGGLTAMANSTASTADEIDKGSIRMGISTKSYQELKYAAGQCGVEMSNLEKAAKKLEGTDLNMNDAMKSIMSFATAEERATRASELFGDNIAYTLSPLIEQSTEDYNGLIERANELGIVMSEDAVKAGVTFGDTMSDVQQSFGGIFNQLSSAIIPIIQVVLDLILDNMPIIQSMINRLAPILVNMLNTILPVFIQFCESLFPIMLDLFEQLLPIFTDIIEDLLPIFTDLLSIILPPLMQIIQKLLPILLPIIEALLPLLTPLLDMIAWTTENVLMPVIDVITSIANIISQVLVKAIQGLKPVVEGIRDIFQKVFGGLFNMVKVPINAIIDGINGFIKGLNKIKIPDWVPLVGGKGINLSLIKKLRVGMDYVPYDEMPAILHKGEAVLSAEQNREYQESKKNKTEPSNITYNNNIVIEKLEVRDESDIEQIAEELYYLQKREVGA